MSPFFRTALLALGLTMAAAPAGAADVAPDFRCRLITVARADGRQIEVLPRALVVFYPDRAFRTEAGGTARVRCRVTEGRLSECEATSASPPDLNFGDGAMRAARQARVPPGDNDHTIDVTFTFALGPRGEVCPWDRPAAP